MKQRKAAGAGLTALVLLVLVASIGLDSGSTDPSREGPQAAAAAPGAGATGPGDSRYPASDRSGRPTIALPATQVDRPAPLQLTRGTLERAWQAGKLDVALPGGGHYSVALEDQRLEPGGQWTVVGRVQTRLGAQAMVLTFGPDAVFGVLPQPDGTLLHVTTSHRKTEVAVAGGLLPPGRTSGLATQPDYLIPAAAGKTASRIGAVRLEAAAPPDASSVTEIDVLGLYSDDLVELRGSVAAAETEMANLFAIVNQAHVDSATGVQFQVAALKQVAIDPGLTNDAVLYAATDNTIAGVDLYTLRDENAADLVAIVRPYHELDPTCGIAWMNGGGRMPQNIVDDYGFSVSNVAPCGPYVLPHELGHNLGSAHDRETMSPNGHVDYGVYRYSFGYRQDGPPSFATIMAYAEYGQPWLGYFSSPDSTSCGAACGVQDHADNVRSLRAIAPVIAGFRGPPGTLSIIDARVYEPEPEPEPLRSKRFLVFSVQLSGVAPAGGVRFDALVTGGSAVSGVDYVAPTQVGGFIPEGEREDWITVELIGDTTKEADETIEVTLANVTGATVHDAEAIGWILNDDPRLKVSGHVRFEGAPAPTSFFQLNVAGLSDASEGAYVELLPPDFAYEVSMVKGATPTFYIVAPAPFAIFPITLGEVRASRVLDITLKKGVHVSGKVKLPPGQPALTDVMSLDFQASLAGVYQPMQIPLLMPPDFEYSQWVVPGSWVYMSLTPPAPYQRIVANRPEAHVDFVQDLPLSTLPGLIVWTPNLTQEGLAGFHGVTSAVVDLSAPAPAGGVTLSYRTVDGTAKAGSDYTAVSGTLEIPEGETTAFTADIILHGDDVFEGDENFYIVVSDVVGANPVVTSVEVTLYERRPPASRPLPPVRKR